MTPPTLLHIDLAKLAANLRAIRGVLSGGSTGSAGARLCAVVKADAYGLGVLPIAGALAEHGVDMFAVDSTHEAGQLFESGLTTPVLVLSPVREIEGDHPATDAAKRGLLHLTVHDIDQLEQLDRAAHTLGCRLPVHPYLDTGMSRLGLDTASAGRALADLASRPNLKLAGLMTHLATADNDPSFAEEQARRFDRFIDEHREALPADTIYHMANTCGTLRGGGYHRSMVRVGMGLLGFGPGLIAAPPQTARLPELQPVARLVSRLVHVQTYPAGATVSYGGTHRLDSDRLLGVVPVGHADGYPLALGNRAVVRVTMQDAPPIDAPVLGRVSMNQIVVDVTPPTNNASHRPRVGDEVELISDNHDAPHSLTGLAGLAGSNVYELLCRLSPRLPRVYTPSNSHP